VREKIPGTLVVTSVALLVVVGAAPRVLAQDASVAYPKMAPIEQYLMADRDAEIALARSAAPESVSHEATILVLGRKGYETAVVGRNGFVCMVDRGWTGPFDWPERWNPKVRATGCLNPQAARSIVPIAELRTRMVLAGRSDAEIVSALATAFEQKRLPTLESGAMAYMMSRSAYLTDGGAHNMPHVMFYTRLRNSADWGANVTGSPVLASPFWAFSSKEAPRVKGLPPMIVFLVGLSTWSDGTAVDHDTQP
jgi:hypothetical protein